MAYTAEQIKKYYDENPEALAAAIQANPEAWGFGTGEPAYSTENQTTGYSDDANKLTFWDPNAGENGGYVTQDMTDATFQEKIAFRDDAGLGYYTNANGDYVYGIKPTSMYQTSLGADDTTMSEGVDPNWQPYTVPDMNGIGRGNPILDDSGATTGYDGGGQRTPENTEIYDTLPNSEYQGWQGSTSHDRDGNIIPGGPADPNSRPVYERGDPFIGSVNDTFGANAGGMNTLDPGYQSNIQGNDLERFGYDSSSNQDFYQRQFADMRAQQMRQDDREGQAREAATAAANAPQGEAFGGDPWAWANLPDIVQGGGGAGQDPNAWIFNPNYGINEQTTNSELMLSLIHI